MQAIVGIVLAAGASSRMGQPKGLLPLAGRPLLSHHLEGLATACGTLRVVVGAHAAALTPVARTHGATVVDNPDWARTGPRESLQRALADLPKGWRAVITPVDVPPAPAWLLRALLADGGAVVPVCAGAPGHPVVVGVAAARRGLAQGTLRAVMRDATRVDVAWPDGALNLNTPAQWQAWLANRRGRADGRG